MLNRGFTVFLKKSFVILNFILTHVKKHMFCFLTHQESHMFCFVTHQESHMFCFVTHWPVQSEHLTVSGVFPIASLSLIGRLDSASFCLELSKSVCWAWAANSSCHWDETIKYYLLYLINYYNVYEKLTSIQTKLMYIVYTFHYLINEAPVKNKIWAFKSHINAA